MSTGDESEDIMECRYGLLDRVLGAEASPVELRAFGQHARECESCRMARDLNADFGRIGIAHGDQLRIARLASETLEAHRRRQSRAGKLAWGRPVYRILLAALVMGGVAAAASMTSILSFGSSDPPLGSEQGATEGAGPKLVEESIGEPKGVSDLPTPEATESPLPEAVQRSGDAPLVAQAPKGAVTLPASKASQETSVTAGSLFRDANQARRRGDRAEAIKLYGSLQRLFPGAAEATLSLVSLGGLLLENGSTSAALLQFDRYLASGANRLTAEALYGRGRALRALGRKNDETKNWQRLLKSYPNSPYSGEARAHLENLP